MFDIGKNSKPPITGIEFHKIPNSDKYVIIVTTLMRIYQYIGAIGNSEEKPLLQQVFYRYLNAQGKREIQKILDFAFSIFLKRSYSRTIRSNSIKISIWITSCNCVKYLNINIKI